MDSPAPHAPPNKRAGKVPPSKSTSTTTAAANKSVALPSEDGKHRPPAAEALSPVELPSVSSATFSDGDQAPSPTEVPDSERHGAEALASTVMRWAIPSKSSAMESSTPVTAESAPTPTCPTPFSVDQVHESIDGNTGLPEQEGEGAKTKRLEKMVRDLNQAKRFLLEKIGEGEEDETKGLETASTNRSHAASSHHVGSQRGKILGARLLETLRSVTQATQEMEDDDSTVESASQRLVERADTTASVAYPGSVLPSPQSNQNLLLPTAPAGDFADPMDSASPFFHSSNALETSGNRLKETIVALHRAARTDAELVWLFRHSRLLCLLPKAEQQRAVDASLRREFSRGETILEKGVPIRHLYVVVWGEVDAFEIVSHTNGRTGSRRDHHANANAQTFYSASAKVAPHHHENMVNEANKTVESPIPQESPGDSVDKIPEPAHVADMYFYQSGGFRDGVGVHQGTLGPGQVFGVEQCVFDGSSDYCFRASLNTEKTVVALIPISLMRQFLQRNIRFAQSAGDALTSAVDVFRPIRDFCRSVFSASTDENEYLPLWAIVESYTHIENVIHTKMGSFELDTGAWGYALSRLPANVTTTFCFNLVHALPPFVASRMRQTAQAADVRKQLTNSKHTGGRTSISFITTKERRRCTWHLGMEGKTLVLLRDGFTDLLDFLTMMCVHIIESNKLRGRLQGMVHPPAIDVLDEYLQRREIEERNGTSVSPDEEIQRTKEILRRMPLTEVEQAGLIRLWKNDTALKMYEVMMHREEYNVRVDPSKSRRFQTNPFHEWALNLRACVLKKIGLKVVDPLPEDLYIDVVSSNTHCIKNLLSSFNRKYKKEILDYARRCEGHRLGPWEEWHNEDDILYASLPGFLQNERPDLKEEYNRSLDQNGITVLHDTAMTGLQVDVIPVHSLHLNHIDGTIRHSVKKWFNTVLRKDNDLTEESELESSQHSLSGNGPHSRNGSTGVGRSRSGNLDKKRGAADKDDDGELPSWSQVCKPVFGDDGKITGIACEPAGQTPARESTAAEDEEEIRLRDDEVDDINTNHHESGPRAGVYRLRRHFIINMDFAFGAQAEGICRAVFSAFGHRIRSVSIMGKAGGIVGKRGDIQLASHVLMSKSSFIIEDNQDELRNCRNDDLTKERLQELAGPRVSVFNGNVLTVTGTMLQNVRLLRYYQRVWGCVGMEMEGSYFARVIEDFHQQGITRPDMISRFAYYTSDLPLAASDAKEAGDGGETETLSSPMTPLEGVPPLYAIARGILERILLP